MRVVGVSEFGGFDSLKVHEIPEPHAGPGQVRVRVRAAAVNPTDTFIATGARAEALRKDPPPYVPGMDVAGVVDELGPGVQTDLAAGDAVMAIVLPRASHGGYSEYLALPAESVVRIPKGRSFAEACTLPMNGLTAQLALDLLDLAPGATLAVTGAAGAYGGYAVELAKAAGLRVVADAAPKDEELVRALGADVIVPRGPDVSAQIRKVVPEGVDALTDGSVQQAEVLGAVRDGGKIAPVRAWTGGEERGITIHQVMVFSYAKERAKLDRLRQLTEDGRITLRVAQTFPAERAADAQRALAAGGARGRMVLEF